MMNVSIDDLQEGDKVKVFLKDAVEKRGGRWIKQEVKNFKGVLSFWQKGWDYGDFTKSEPLPAELFRDDTIIKL